MQQGNPRLDRRGRDHLHLEPEDLRHRRAAPQFLEPFLVGGEGQGTTAPVAGGLTGFRLQAQVEFAGIARQFGHVDGRAELAHQPRRVPSGARGELPALQQRHAGDPGPRQVIGDRAGRSTPPPTTTTPALRGRSAGRSGLAVPMDPSGAQAGGWPDRGPVRSAPSPAAGARALRPSAPCRDRPVPAARSRSRGSAARNGRNRR